MTYEEIQQAANNYVGHEPETDESCYVSAKRVAFKDGAKWMQERLVKNLWHDASESPELYKTIFVCNGNAGYTVLVSSSTKIPTDKKWCYLEDILPNNKERQHDR